MDKELKDTLITGEELHKKMVEVDNKLSELSGFEGKASVYDTKIYDLTQKLEDYQIVLDNIDKDPEDYGINPTYGFKLPL